MARAALEGGEEDGGSTTVMRRRYYKQASFVANTAATAYPQSMCLKVCNRMLAPGRAHAQYLVPLYPSQATRVQTKSRSYAQYPNCPKSQGVLRTAHPLPPPCRRRRQTGWLQLMAPWQLPKILSIRLMLHGFRYFVFPLSGQTGNWFRQGSFSTCAYVYGL